ncbi:MAG: 3-oxoacyl-(acyl-carrier-protein) synthase 3 [candidate division WS6 bacterium OLB21]|uniref:3-oxoacyl-(Acyl-carrier-protein) synthase 3 n=1 Tax=candidate division WS6 bacterium OLB21 TaxID=1617427 RepID=A0A136KM26_9BACT|nr:MAG: 3-oxoacyl-(acyl-carrier-protein) synthase 3 [candidate division WS6 bacterium OLB21]
MKNLDEEVDMKINNSGIVSYGVSIPRRRISINTIASVWGKDGEQITSSLGLVEKTVPAPDEDTISLAMQSAKYAVDNISAKKLKIGAIYTGSESHPYAVKSTSAIVGEALGIGNSYTAADTEFACKAGTAALQMILGLSSSKMIEYGLAIGADTAQSRPADALEYSAAAAGAAYLIGTDPKEIIANVLFSSSFTSDTPDFWRRGHELYPSHAGRFTGEPAYFKHVYAATKAILEESNYKPSDFAHAVFHMPNARFPQKAAKDLGFNAEQLRAGFTVPLLGNSYSACSLVGLAAVLDVAKPNEKIFVCSYGSGSGSDAFVIETTNNIKYYKNSQTVKEQIENKTYVDYSYYITSVGKIKL